MNKMESMEVKRLVFSMSLPIIISMLVQALYNIVDSIFVAGISQDALLSVSLCYPIQTIMVAVACGLGAGFNTVLAGYLGEKNFKMADHTLSHGIYLSLICALLFAIFGMFCAEWFLSFFTTQDNVIAMGAAYIRICTLFSFGVFVQITYERIMQATGNVIYNMILQGAGALINIILDPILIYGYFGLPAMGTAGAAIATVIGQIAAMSIGILLVQHKVKELHVKLFPVSISLLITKRILIIAIPSMLMQSVMSFMTVFMNMILSAFSAMAISVFSVYYKLQQFVFMAVSGMTNALIPIIAYNHGAKRYDRIIQASDFSLIAAAGIMLAGTIVFELFPKELLSLFHADGEMYAIGIPALRIISISFVAAWLTMVICSILQALNLAGASLVLTLLRQMIILLPLTYILARLLSLSFAWWSFPITEVFTAVLALVFYNRVKGNLRKQLA